MFNNINILQVIKKYKWLLIASFFSALTVIVIKYYEKVLNNWLLLVSLLSEVGLIYSYVQLLKTDDILTQIALVKIVAILIIIIPSMLFFGSQLTISKILGLIFATIAIYLLT